MKLRQRKFDFESPYLKWMKPAVIVLDKMPDNYPKMEMEEPYEKETKDQPKS